MSISSYRRNVERRVAGPKLPDCFPASLEQISPYHSYRPHIYTYYKEFVDYLDSLTMSELATTKVHKEHEDMIEYLINPLGGYLLSDIVLKTINTEIGLKRALNQYSDDHRIVVDVKYGNNSKRAVHSVGVVKHDQEHISLLSTHVPEKLRGIISIGRLATSLAINEDNSVRNHPIATANFLALPNY